MKKTCLVAWISMVSIAALAQAKPVTKSAQPIGIFDSGTGGLTVLEAILSLDQFNNRTAKPGADGKPDFEAERFQYLADQANMPYGNYAAEKKTDLLKEHILKNMAFFFDQQFVLQRNQQWMAQAKPSAKMLVIACNTATAYALSDIKAYTQQLNNHVPVVGVIDAGAKAALQYQASHKGTIGVFATAGTVASNGYPRTLQALAATYALSDLSIVSQGGLGLAESIDRDWNYFADTAKVIRNAYKGPSLKNNTYPINPLVMEAYHFDKSNNRLLCEYDDKGSCLDMQLNDPSNYVRYHLVTLLEKMRLAHTALPLNTLILGCTHYPYMKDTIRKVLTELYDFKVKDQFVYRNYLAAQVELVDPAIETAKEAYLALHEQQLQNVVMPSAQLTDEFFISVPNTLLEEVQLQSDGWFTYGYKYGRNAGGNKKYVQYVPFDKWNVSAATYQRFSLVLPHVYAQLPQSVK